MHSKALISVLLLGLAPLAVVADEIHTKDSSRYW